MFHLAGGAGQCPRLGGRRHFRIEGGVPFLHTATLRSRLPLLKAGSSLPNQPVLDRMASWFLGHGRLLTAVTLFLTVVSSAVRGG